MKKLKLQRETIRNLPDAYLERIQGGAGGVSIIQRTMACPVYTHGCTGGGCVETIGTSGTSVINPSTSIINPSGG
ncbi:MAG TPA: hypothetical protein VLM79_20035 [Kofleriaceae bacterium]|nr:hypothetical protein [Kofleriaceae bacterium]